MRKTEKRGHNAPIIDTVPSTGRIPHRGVDVGHLPNTGNRYPKEVRMRS